MYDMKTFWFRLITFKNVIYLCYFEGPILKIKWKFIFFLQTYCENIFSYQFLNRLMNDIL